MIACKLQQLFYLNSMFPLLLLARHILGQLFNLPKDSLTMLTPIFTLHWCRTSWGIAEKTKLKRSVRGPEGDPIFAQRLFSNKTAKWMELIDRVRISSVLKFQIFAGALLADSDFTNILICYYFKYRLSPLALWKKKPDPPNPIDNVAMDMRFPEAISRRSKDTEYSYQPGRYEYSVSFWENARARGISIPQST